MRHQYIIATILGAIVGGLAAYVILGVYAAWRELGRDPWSPWT